jgi:translocation and assembly module TamA
MKAVIYKIVACKFIACKLCISIAYLIFMIIFMGGYSVAFAETDRIPVIRVDGMEPSPLRSLLESLSPSMWQSQRPAVSEAVLRERANRHQEHLKQALQSEGYYKPEITFSITWTDSASPQLDFHVVQGPAYCFDTVGLRIWETQDNIKEPELKLPVEIDSGLQKGTVARSSDILNAESKIVQQLNAAGYPFVQVFDREVTVNHDTNTLSVAYFIAAGKRMLFGPVRITGLREVQTETVQRQFSWFEGAWYDERLLKESQEKLQSTGLFSSVRIRPLPVEESSEGRIPIEVELTERRQRSISLGLQYRTDEGVGAGINWEHRNFLNQGRRLRIQSQLTELEQNFGISYDIQEFMSPKDTLTLHAKTTQLDTDQYRSRRIDVGAWLEHPLSSEWTVGFGPALRLSRVNEPRRSQQYYLITFPFQVTLDRRDDRMDPQRGFRLTNRISPFVDVQDIDTCFLKNEFNVTCFLPFGKEKYGLTLAARLRLGIAGGASLADIPADERFYAGGGGSIRGYAFQKVGPLDKEGIPTGGRSLTDWSLELRKRLNERFGIVAFVDGGMAHETLYFDFGDAVQWGAGLGLRYFTPIGPVRLDVAVPVNRRDGVDSSAQFYISIGQAF